jgi:hypothetical protein
VAAEQAAASRSLLAFFCSSRTSIWLRSVGGVWPTPYDRQTPKLPGFALLTAAVGDGLLAAVPRLETVGQAARGC